MGGLRIASRFDPTADLVLFQGDCLDLLPQIPAGLVKMVVTSPPYKRLKRHFLAVPVKVILIDVDETSPQ